MWHYRERNIWSSSLIESIVLAGGLGTRLRSAVSDVPKPMAPINGRPFLDLLLFNLSQKGIKRVILSVGYMSQVIQDYFGKEKYGLLIDYNIEKNPLGTGGAIYSCLKNCKSEGVLVINGDSYINYDHKKLIKKWLEYKKPVVVTRKTKSSSRNGNITFEKDKIQSFSNLNNGKNDKKITINAGVYILPKNLFNPDSTEDVFSFELDYLPKAVKSQDFYMIKSEGYFVDIGIPSDFKKAQSELVKNIENV